MMSRYQRGAASNHFPVYHHCHSIFSWVAGLAPVLSPHTLGPGRDADRRKKTGWRRRIVIKEDLAAEERSLQGWVSSCAGPQSCSHWSLFSIIMSCVVWAPDLGRSTSLVTSHSLSLSCWWRAWFGYAEVLLIHHSQQNQPSLISHCVSPLVEEEGSLSKKTWLQKNPQQQVSSCPGPCCCSWWTCPLSPRGQRQSSPGGTGSRSMGVQGQFLRCRATLNKLNRWATKNWNIFSFWCTNIYSADTKIISLSGLSLSLSLSSIKAVEIAVVQSRDEKELCQVDCKPGQFRVVFLRVLPGFHPTNKILLNKKLI